MKRWALMKGDVVDLVTEAATQPQIPGTWREVTGLVVGPGHRYTGGQWLSPAEQVPPVVTMRQARLALFDAGLLDDVEAAINALPEPAKTRAQITWDKSQEVQRENGLVSQLAPAMGLTPAQIDALFIAAGKL